MPALLRARLLGSVPLRVPGFDVGLSAGMRTKQSGYQDGAERRNETPAGGGRYHSRQTIEVKFVHLRVPARIRGKPLLVDWFPMLSVRYSPVRDGA